MARNPLYFCARVFLLIGRDFRPFDSPGFHSQFFMSTRRPRNRTPSLSRRNRCSAAESPRNLISPPAPSTRCQGNPNPRCKMRATMRDRPGYPAAWATPPYVNTLPRGIARITCSMRSRMSPASLAFLERFLTLTRLDFRIDKALLPDIIMQASRIVSCRQLRPAREVSRPANSEHVPISFVHAGATLC